MRVRHISGLMPENYAKQNESTSAKVSGSVASLNVFSFIAVFVDDFLPFIVVINHASSVLNPLFRGL